MILQPSYYSDVQKVIDSGPCRKALGFLPSCRWVITTTLALPSYLDPVLWFPRNFLIFHYFVLSRFCFSVYSFGNSWREFSVLNRNRRPCCGIYLSQWRMGNLRADYHFIERGNKTKTAISLLFRSEKLILIFFLLIGKFILWHKISTNFSSIGNDHWSNFVRVKAN